MAVKGTRAKKTEKAVAKKATRGLKVVGRELTKAKKSSSSARVSASTPTSSSVMGGACAMPFGKGMDSFAKAFKLPEFNFNEMESVMTKPNFQFDQIATDAAASGRESMEAFIKFGTILAKGCEDIIRTAATLTQSSAEKQAEYAKQMMGAKTLNEFTSAQNKIAQASFDQFMANATKLSEMSIKVLNDSIAPLNDQMVKGVNKATKMAA